MWGCLLVATIGVQSMEQNSGAPGRWRHARSIVPVYMTFALLGVVVGTGSEVWGSWPVAVVFVLRLVLLVPTLVLIDRAKRLAMDGAPGLTAGAVKAWSVALAMMLLFAVFVLTRIWWVP